jgi:hypothetical protein
VDRRRLHPEPIGHLLDPEEILFAHRSLAHVPLGSMVFARRLCSAATYSLIGFITCVFIVFDYNR